MTRKLSVLLFTAALLVFGTVAGCDKKAEDSKPAPAGEGPTFPLRLQSLHRDGVEGELHQVLGSAESVGIRQVAGVEAVAQEDVEHLYARR